MSEPDKNRFACIGCGVMNPVGAKVCAGCGHRFAGPEVGLPSKARLAPTPNPRPVSAVTSLVPSILVAIGVIGIGVVVFVTFPPLGIAFFVAALSAGVWTWIVSIRRAKAGRRIDSDERLNVFAGTLVGTLVVLISSAIAFVVTCFPVGLYAFSTGRKSNNDILGIVAFGGGGLAALAVGGGMAAFLIRIARSRAAKKSQDEERP